MSGRGIAIDHVVLAVRDLDDAAARFTSRTGLATVEGGRHERWGTENRIVPLGDDYLELLAVVDPEVGGATPLGRALMSACLDGDAWFSVCVADPDIEATGARLGLTLESGSRVRPDGVEVRWRGAGIDDPARPPWLPFFIAWDVPPELHPARAMAAHAVTPVGRLPGRGCLRVLEVGLLADDPHALAAAAGRGFHEDGGISMPPSSLGGYSITERSGVPGGHDRDAGGHGDLASMVLARHRLHRLGRRADPDEAGRAHGAGERRVLREEAVAGVDGLRPGGQRLGDLRVAVEVVPRADGRLDAEPVGGAGDPGGSRHGWRCRRT